MLSPTRRLPGLRELIDQEHYFVIHAPRQVGKTTALMALARELSAEGKHAAVLVSAEQGQGLELDEAELPILNEWASAATDLPEPLRPPRWPDAPPGDRVRSALSAWAEGCPRPLVVFIDEIDALSGQTLVSMLRQLRAGFRRRPEHFPSSLALVGVRDVRDYKVHPNEQRPQLGTSSPFNIKVESLTMRNFTRDEVAELYEQHTADTGQVFEAAAVDRAHELSDGQPWLINAMARLIVQKIRPDPTQAVVVADVDEAARQLIERQDTHLDSLAERLREPRVRAIVEPMLAGTTLGDIPPDDVRFVVDLGLLRPSEDGGLVVANPIYREVIIRQLSAGPRASLPHIAPTWIDGSGELDPSALADAFMAFWRQHGDAMLGSAPYHEVAAQLVLMAFLHRVVNGGGSIEREYALGRGRMDLCLRLGSVTIGMELKVWRDGAADPLARGLVQLDGYLEGLGLPSGWLVVFDRRKSAGAASTRTRREAARSPAGRDVLVIRA
jgi:DNA polymerase III delta prime subunit